MESLLTNSKAQRSLKLETQGPGNGPSSCLGTVPATKLTKTTNRRGEILPGSWMSFCLKAFKVHEGSPGQDNYSSIVTMFRVQGSSTALSRGQRSLHVIYVLVAL